MFALHTLRNYTQYLLNITEIEHYGYKNQSCCCHLEVTDHWFTNSQLCCWEVSTRHGSLLSNLPVSVGGGHKQAFMWEYVFISSGKILKVCLSPMKSICLTLKKTIQFFSKVAICLVFHQECKSCKCSSLSPAYPS